MKRWGLERLHSKKKAGEKGVRKWRGRIHEGYARIYETSSNVTDASKRASIYLFI